MIECDVPGCGSTVGVERLPHGGLRCALHRNPAVTVTCSNEPYGPAATAWLGEMYKNATYALRKGVPLSVLQETLARAGREFAQQPAL